MPFAQHSRKNKGDSKASPYWIISHSTPQAQVYNFVVAKTIHMCIILYPTTSKMLQSQA